MKIYLVNEFRKNMKIVLQDLRCGGTLYLKQHNKFYNIIYPENQMELRGIYETNRDRKKKERRIKGKGISPQEPMGEDKIKDTQ